MKTIRFRRDESHYRYESAYATYRVFKFVSGWGDIQWGCDIFYLDGRSLPHDYMQAYTLGEMRDFIAGIEEAGIVDGVYGEVTA